MLKKKLHRSLFSQLWEEWWCYSLQPWNLRTCLHQPQQDVGKAVLWYEEHSPCLFIRRVCWHWKLNDTHCSSRVYICNKELISFDLWFVHLCHILKSKTVKNILLQLLKSEYLMVCLVCEQNKTFEGVSFDLRGTMMDIYHLFIIFNSSGRPTRGLFRADNDYKKSSRSITDIWNC